MQQLYLANPLGFSELGRISLSVLQSVLSKYFYVYEPFSATPKEQLDALWKGEENADFDRLRTINRDIARSNIEAIEECDVLFAVVDGSDIDSGVAWEIGYAHAKGKKIYLLRTDVRWSGDNLGDKINLQVKCSPGFTGGITFTSINEIDEWFSKP